MTAEPPTGTSSRAESRAASSADGPLLELPVPLVLASGSPRRRQLLEQLGLAFDVRPSDIDETPRPGEAPVEYVARLARGKAEVAHRPDVVALAADTTVEVDGTILEKPVDDADARRMLRLLSGRTHHVHTGVCVVGPGIEAPAEATLVASTAVVFVELTDAMIDWYVASGEPDDKAGAYAIQGAGGAFVERLDGSVTNVIGLPLAETLALLRRVAAGV